jgi:hypothetical protein
VTAYLHLRAAVLEPELDLARLQAQALAQVGALLVVRVGILLEQPAQTTPIHAVSRARERGKEGRTRRDESVRRLRFELLDLVRRVAVVPLLPLARVPSVGVVLAAAAGVVAGRAAVVIRNLRRVLGGATSGAVHRR